MADTASAPVAPPASNPIPDPVAAPVVAPVATPAAPVSKPDAAGGDVVVAISSPFYLTAFDPSLEGCPVVTQHGVSVPGALVDQAIAKASELGIELVRRS